MLMEHGGEGGGQRRLLGASRSPEGRCPVLRRRGGPGRHPPRCPASHPGAAAALEARTSSDQGSREGARPGIGRCLGCGGAAWTPVSASFQVRVPGLCGCCAGEVLDCGLYMCLALRFSLIPMQSWAHASLDPPHSPALEVLKHAARRSTCPLSAYCACSPTPCHCACPLVAQKCYPATLKPEEARTFKETSPCTHAVPSP